MTADPAALVRLAWEELLVAVSSPDHPWRTPVLVSGGSQPDGRVVVLRRFQRTPDRLTFFTDARSPKVTAFLENSRVTWVFYNPALRFQARVHAVATIHQGTAMVRQDWEGLTVASRREYASATAPGSPWPGLPPLAWDEAARNFAVIETVALEWDCLQLSRSGHGRVRFTGDDCERLVP